MSPLNGLQLRCACAERSLIAKAVSRRRLRQGIANGKVAWGGASIYHAGKGIHFPGAVVFQESCQRPNGRADELSDLFLNGQVLHLISRTSSSGR
jgi:hypothetical protein